MMVEETELPMGGGKSSLADKSQHSASGKYNTVKCNEKEADLYKAPRT